MGVGVREWMVKTLSPFPVVAGRREIYAQRRMNDADVRETKKPTDGEPLIRREMSAFISRLKLRLLCPQLIHRPLHSS